MSEPTHTSTPAVARAPMRNVEPSPASEAAKGSISNLDAQRQVRGGLPGAALPAPPLGNQDEQRAAKGRAPREAEADVLGRAAAGAPALGSRGGGSALPGLLRAELERATGEDLSTVRVHTGPAADAEARAMHAVAFARGDDLVFSAGEYRPDHDAGRSLIQHEVGHVLQQRMDGAARVDRQPAAPQKVFAAAVLTETHDAVQQSVFEQSRFWDLLGGLDDKLVEGDSISDDDKQAVVAAFHPVIASLSGITASIELADQAAATTVDWDSACKLLSKQLGSSALSAYALPTSFGTDLFLTVCEQSVGAYLIALGQVILDAYDKFDPSSTATTLAAELQTAVTGALAVQKAALAEQLSDAVATWGDPFGLLELELEGAIAALVAARAELAGAKTDAERAGAGKRIGFIAREILLIDAHLVDAATRKARRASGERVEAVGQTDEGGDVATIVENARTAAASEKDTLQAKGNERAELRPRSVEIDEPLLDDDATRAKVTPEEAYPHYDDAVMMEALRALAAETSAKAEELETQRRALVPKRITDLAAFTIAYKRWFGFFSRMSRDQDPGFKLMTEIYRTVMPLAAMGGPDGWFGRVMLTQMMGDQLASGSADPTGFDGEVSRIKFERRETTTGGVVGNDDRTGVTYQTGELPVGSSAAPADDRTARDDAVASQSERSRDAFKAIYVPPTQERPGVARALGRLDGQPGPMSWWDRDQLDTESSGFATSWSYLLATEILTQSGDIENAHEHKAMREEVAHYLVSRAQALQAVGQPHTVKDEYGKAIGEPLEQAPITAEARYLRGEPDDARNPEAERLQAQVRAAKAAIEANTPLALVQGLEAAMTGYLATADAASRVIAVLTIGVLEDDLPAQLMSAFNAKAIEWAVGISVGVSAVLYILGKLGPIGQIAGAIIQRRLHKLGISVAVADVVTVGQWAFNAGRASTFQAAQRWAFVGADVAGELSQLMRDYAIAQVQKGLVWALKSAFRAPGASPHDIGSQIRDSFGKDPAGREMLAEIEQGVRKSLDAGQPDVLTKESIEFLKTADPDGYARMVRDYPQAFKDAVAPAPELRAGSAAADMHTLVQAGVDPAIAGRVNVVEVPGDSVRVRVKGGALEIEVGRQVPTDAAGQAMIEGHLGSVRRLSRFVGPMGRVRHMLARVGAALGFLTISNRGGEAAEEIAKLNDIRTRLEKLRSASDDELTHLASDPDAVSDADLDSRIAKIQAQIDGYSTELDSTVVGKGYIAAEGNFAALEKANILGKPLDKDALAKLGYRVDKNDVIYRPVGATGTMEPLEVVDIGGTKIVRVSMYESPAALQARVYESLPATKKVEFDALANAAPPGTEVRLVEGVHDTRVTWKEVFGDPRTTVGRRNRQALEAILTDSPDAFEPGAGMSKQDAKALVDKLLASPETLKVVIGTDPVRDAFPYRTRAGITDTDIAHHFDPLYLGGGHELISKLPGGAHGRVHEFFDNLRLPNGTRLQPGELQHSVRATAKPAVVLVNQETGAVTYKPQDQTWTP